MQRFEPLAAGEGLVRLPRHNKPDAIGRNGGTSETF
jgi:hypothetical protein